MIKKITHIITFLVFTINISLGCDCLMSSLETEIKVAEIIMKVRIDEILDTEIERKEYLFPNYQKTNEDIKKGYRARIEILKRFKGNYNEGQILELNSTFSNCEFIYNIGEEYVLFLKNDGNGIFLKTCSYSEKISDTKKSKRRINRLIKKIKRFN